MNFRSRRAVRGRHIHPDPIAGAPAITNTPTASRGAGWEPATANTTPPPATPAVSQGAAGCPRERTRRSTTSGRNAGRATEETVVSTEEEREGTEVVTS